MTKSHLMRDNPEMMSSTMPSAKYSCSGSLLRFWKAKTAIEGRSGRASRRLGTASVSVQLDWSCFSRTDRKSTRLNSSHVELSYAVFCLKKKKESCFLLLIKKKTKVVTTS